MITKTTFKALLKVKSATIDLDGTSASNHLCEIRDSHLLVLSPEEVPVLRVKLNNPDKAWTALQEFLMKEHKESKDYQDAKKKKLLKMAEKYSQRFLKQIKGITLKNADAIEYHDTIDHLIVCKYILSGDIPEADSHMQGLDTASRESIPDDLYELLDEVADFVDYN